MPDLSFWAESRWNRSAVRPYGFRSTAYTTGLHRGQDAPAGDWGTRPIPAIRPGRVVQTYRTTALGWIVVVDAGPGAGPFRFDCYCHLAQQDAAPLGASVRVGDPIGRAAREWEAPGIVGVTWLGMHIHLVVSTVARGGDSVYAPTTDPRPIIRAALGGSPAGSGSTPFEEDDMYSQEDRDRDNETARVLEILRHEFIDGRDETGLDERVIDTLFDSARRIRGYERDASGKPNPEYPVADVLQHIRTEIKQKTIRVDLDALADGLAEKLASRTGVSVDDVRDIVRTELEALKPTIQGAASEGARSVINGATIQATAS